MDYDEKDTQSLSGTTIAASTFSADTVVAPPSSSTHLEHRFYKGNGMSSKASIQSRDGKEYQLVADIHRTKPSTIQVFAGKGKGAPLLGELTFPHTYNNFSLSLAQQTDPHFIQVRARVGHPHPTSYNFVLPPTKTSGPKSVTWTKFEANSNRTGYHLREEGSNSLIASWYLVSREKHQALLHWHVEPTDEMMKSAVLLSFIGALSRLKLKGKDDSENGSGLARWNGMWFMAILGTAAVA